MRIPGFSERRATMLARTALSSHVLNGLSAGVGLLLISSVVQFTLGTFAAAAASIGVIAVVPSDQAAPRRGKFWQLLPSVLIGVPLFYGVRVLHADPWALGLLIIPASFVCFLGAAWGRRGIPVSMSAMFAIVFGLAVPARSDLGYAGTWYFALGAVSFMVFATASNALLNARYRVQILAETLLSIASLMRSQADQFAAGDRTEPAAGPIGRLLRGQAAFADQLQSSRDILLESPRTRRRQQLAGMLVRILEMRDQLLACELDVDFLIVHRGYAPVLTALKDLMNEHADAIDELADSFLWGRAPRRFDNRRHRLENLPWSQVEHAGGSDPPSSPDMLARGLASRIRNISDETEQLTALARREVRPDLSVVREYWQMFISPTAWSWQPLRGLWYWDAPPLRHAIRAALAVATGYGISLVVPWKAHAYWILLTIVVVLRGSLAQTLERRNSRVAGTLLGSVIAGGLLTADPPRLVVGLIVPLAQGVAHAFSVKRYLITAVAATVLALLQAHLLSASGSTVFQVFERIADTIIGVGVAWAFSYVLPAWERTQIPALVARTLEAQARHAHVSLELGQRAADDSRPELEWRLARREAYDSLSALVQAAQRCLAEPRAVRPPLEPLERLVAHSYQLLAQLTAIKTMLLLRRSHVDIGRCKDSLGSAMSEIAGVLQVGKEAPGAVSAPPTASLAEPLSLPDPFGQDVTPWLLRRLALATELSRRLREDAGRITPPRRG